VAICNALEQGDYAAARSLIARIAMFETLRAQERNGTNVSVVKAALQLLGEDCGAPRPPAAWPLHWMLRVHGADRHGRASGIGSLSE
jgi:4-hydroxy-tetrahydrodipicolinate synthase